MSEINDIYRELLSKLYIYGFWETNNRTQTRIRVLRGGYSFTLDLSDCKLPIPGNRRYYPSIAAAETAWQFLGTQNPDFILTYAPKMWKDFIDNDNLLTTAYGYRWRKHFGRDQIAMTIEELRYNSTNRQLYISAWDPSRDGLGAKNPPKNIPCPIGFSIYRLKNQIHMSVYIRSSDVVVGLPYDIMSYALTLQAISHSTFCRAGTLQICIAHAHYYEPHSEIVNESLKNKQWRSDIQINLPSKWCVEDIEKQPHDYVGFVRLDSDQFPKTEYSPQPILVK